VRVSYVFLLQDHFASGAHASSVNELYDDVIAEFRDEERGLELETDEEEGEMTLHAQRTTKRRRPPLETRNDDMEPSTRANVANISERRVTPPPISFEERDGVSFPKRKPKPAPADRFRSRRQREASSWRPSTSSEGSVSVIPTTPPKSSSSPLSSPFQSHKKKVSTGEDFYSTLFEGEEGLCLGNSSQPADLPRSSLFDHYLKEGKIKPKNH